MKTLKKALAEKMLAWIERAHPDLLLERVKSLIVDRANELAERNLMAYLEREGLVHCGYCARRFGLRVIGGKHVCERHRDKALNQQRGAVAVAGSGRG